MYIRAISASGPLRQNHFWGLDKSFYTLLQFVTLDDIADVYYPLILEKPYLGGFFFPILIFISIGLMNLVTASLVENAMQTAAIEAEEERLKLKKKVKGVTWSRSPLRVGKELHHGIAFDIINILYMYNIINISISQSACDQCRLNARAPIHRYTDQRTDTPIRKRTHRYTDTQIQSPTRICYSGTSAYQRNGVAAYRRNGVTA